MAEKKKRISDVIELDGVKYSCRVYDNRGETLDRYTACFAREVDDRGYSVYPYIGCNSEPFHGIGYRGESQHKIDGSHLGRRIQFDECPIEVRKFIMLELKGRR